MKKLIVFLLFVTAIVTNVAAQDSALPAPAIDKGYITRFPKTKADFPGGMQVLKTWLGENLTYPSEAVKQGIQGTVIVEFIVYADGSIDDVRAIRKVHESLDNEAIRVVKLMPKWIPGTNENDVAVATYFQLPVQFKLEKQKELKK